MSVLAEMSIEFPLRDDTISCETSRWNLAGIWINFVTGEAPVYGPIIP